MDVQYIHVLYTFSLPSLPPSLPLSPLCVDGLDKRCEDLQFHNHTLLDDKKQLQEQLDDLKAAGSKGNEDGGLERELRELQDSLHQKVHVDSDLHVHVYTCMYKCNVYVDAHVRTCTCI